jgi:adenylate cyclase
MVPFTYIKFKALAPWNMARDEMRLLRTALHEYHNLQEKIKHSNEALGKYVGTNISDKAVKQAVQSQLGGESRRVYVLFSDVRGFTRMTEQLKVDETLEILNKMFTSMEEVIAAGGGEINKYIGDAILAYFRRPYSNESEAAKAVLNTALRMQDRFEMLNDGFKTGYSKPVDIGLGIGITAGEAIVGNLGSTKRMEFTLIGDTVNLASRLCGIAKHGQILVNEEMAQVAKAHFDLDALPPVQIKGKSGLHTPYAVTRQSLSMGR